MRVLGIAVLCAMIGCSVDVDDEAAVGRTHCALRGGAPNGDIHAAVALLRDGRYVCSATLVARRRAVTAAHCLSDGLPDAASGLAVRIDGNNGTAAVRVTAAEIDPAFDRATLANDIAWLRLDAEVTSYAAMATPSLIPSVGGDVELVAYGAAPNDAALTRTRGRARILDATEREMVLGPAPGEAARACRGDSGGSVFVMHGGERVLVAVISGGDAACSGRAYAARLPGGVGDCTATTR